MKLETIHTEELAGVVGGKSISQGDVCGTAGSLRGKDHPGEWQGGSRGGKKCGSAGTTSGTGAPGSDPSMGAGWSVAKAMTVQTLDTIDLDRLADVTGAAKAGPAPSGGVCSQSQTGEWFPDTDMVPDPSGATFKTKRACESWSKKNLPL